MEYFHSRRLYLLIGALFACMLVSHGREDLNLSDELPVFLDTPQVNEYRSNYDVIKRFAGNRMLSRSAGGASDSRMHQFLCTLEEAKRPCPLGGQGPLVMRKVNVKLSVCVCYCPTGYKDDKGCSG